MSPKALDVWMYGAKVAVLHERRTNKISLEYTDEAANRWSNGQPVVSVSMPMHPERRYSPSRVGRWLEGLLPEGEARTSIERAKDVRRGDVFGLLAAIGRDCAGAIVIQPAGDPAPPDPGPPSADAISDAEVAAELAGLSDRPLGVAGDVRVSLAGQQPKLILSRTASGSWGRPAGGTPSTHILKPQDDRFPGYARNEATCVNAANRLGLGTIDADVERFGGREVIVVTRYDRRIDPRGRIHRIHQEDLCQALSIPTEEKYWREHGHPMRAAARALDVGALDGRAALRQLAMVVTFNATIGNADGHAKNYSFLHHENGTISLAPIYDASSTIQYPTVQGPEGARSVSRGLALPVSTASSVDDITAAHLVDEATTWGLSRRDAEAAIWHVLLNLPDQVAGAQHDLDWDDQRANDLFISIRGRAQALRDGAPAGRGDPSVRAYNAERNAIRRRVGLAEATRQADDCGQPTGDPTTPCSNRKGSCPEHL